ncbi:MAG: ABC transporter permease subunit/CPBP intramembrane protease [Candidatus Cloacimonadota bacterium]|nr:ABC transporter permease subunit/CPBP intramembrane protease [Candidatus Cloacimonadota bacterium]
MNLSKIFTIYKKEMLDIFRDKRTLITSIILPIVLYPFIMIGYTSIISRQETKLEEKGVKIGIENSINNFTTKLIQDSISVIDNLEIIQESQTYQNMFEQNKIDAIIKIYESEKIDNFDRFVVKIIYDASNDESKLAYDKIVSKLKSIELDLVRIRLQKLEISENILEVIDVEKDNQASKEKMFGFMMGKILPYILIMMLISGGAVVSSDLVAGEKERKTLETLLVSAATRTQLVVGKYLTIITISLITLLLNLFSIYLSFKHLVGQANINMSDFNMPFQNFVLVFLIMLPLVTFFAAILLSISTYSRNMKEAGTYLTPIMMVSMMMSLISSLPGVKMSFGMALIPVVNFALLFKDIMMSDFSVFYFFVTIIWTIILDVIAIYISIQLFKNESVLFRVESEKSLKFWGKKNTKNIFSEEFGFIFFIAITLLLYYVGGSWQSKDIFNGLIKTQILLIFVPTYFVLKISKQNIKEVIRLNMPKISDIGWFLLMIIPAFISSNMIMNLVNHIYPIPESYLKVFEELLGGTNISIWRAVVIIGVLPGLCEEFMFRGYIINVFKKRGFWKSILISGLLFALMHLDMYRFPSVAFLGIFLGYMLLRTNSIIIPILFHIANNSLGVLLSRDVIPQSILEFFFPDQSLSLVIGILGMVIFAILIYLFEKSKTQKRIL